MEEKEEGYFKWQAGSQVYEEIGVTNTKVCEHRQGIDFQA